MTSTLARLLIRRAGVVAFALLAPNAGAQILRDGNMDALTLGTAPDFSTYAGAWGFPALYQTNAIAEPAASPGVFSIVATGSFQAGAPGNSLRLFSPSISPSENYHLPNVWTPALIAAPGLVVRVTFNLWVVSGAAGGAVYVGGDNGGGGFSSAGGDRTAQVIWTSDGQIKHTDNSGNNAAVFSYPFDTWQNVRIDIDTFAHTFNLYWSAGATAVAPIGLNLPFRAPDPTLSVRYDRVTFGQFGVSVPNVNAYIDNVVVTAVHACGSADFDCDGAVGTDSDIESFFACLSGACPVPPCAGSADFNNDGDVGTDADIESFFRVVAGGPC